MELNTRRIEMFMAEHKDSITSLAKRAGLSPIVLRNVLQKGIKATYRTVGKLADALGVPVAEIVAE